MRSRREFLTLGAAALTSLGSSRGPAGAAWQSPAPAGNPLDILILGGTSFLGPHQVAYALGRGHSVTTFTRGRTEPTVHRELFSQVESLIGDRENDLEALRGRSWDAVIDNSGRQAAWTRATAELLRDNVGIYQYTSSTGVYYPYRTEDIGEETPLVLAMPPGTTEDDDPSQAFGVMKANSERETLRVFGEDRSILVRPTFMMGPGDTTERFPYWAERLARGGEVLVPGRPDDPAQYVDVRDVAGWMIRLIEERRAGAFNAVGPASRSSILRFVHGAHAAFASPVEFVVVDDYEFLRRHQVTFAVPWIMPVDENYGIARVSNARAIANGLTFRPLAASIGDIYAWWHSENVPEERRTQLVSGERSLMAREPSILADWRNRP
jgi:2'-hydroxyisoflavone reductase